MDAKRMLKSRSGSSCGSSSRRDGSSSQLSGRGPRIGRKPDLGAGTLKILTKSGRSAPRWVQGRKRRPERGLPSVSANRFFRVRSPLGAPGSPGGSRGGARRASGPLFGRFFDEFGTHSLMFLIPGSSHHFSNFRDVSKVISDLQEQMLPPSALPSGGQKSKKIRVVSTVIGGH